MLHAQYVNDMSSYTLVLKLTKQKNLKKNEITKKKQFI